MVGDRKREITFVLIGFKRFENLKQNILTLLNNGVKSEFICCFMDGLDLADKIIEADKLEFVLFCKLHSIRTDLQIKNLGLKDHFNYIFREVSKFENSYLFFIEDDVKIYQDFINFGTANFYLMENSQIATISSINHCSNIYNSFNYLTRYHHSWGWVTHTRFVKQFINFNLDTKAFWDIIKVKNFNPRIKFYWLFKMFGLKFNFINSWAYKWQLFCIVNDLKSLVPAFSLCEVNGTDSLATNTGSDLMAKVEIKQFDFDKYEVRFDENRDECIDRMIFSKGNIFRMMIIPLKKRLIKIDAKV